MLVDNSKKIVIKLGSTTVVDSKGKFKKKWVSSLIKDIKKFKSIFDDSQYKIESIIEILSLSNNTPKKYLKDLRFLFAAKI